MSTPNELAQSNYVSPNHPHGPPDPRWITDEGRCLLCAYSYHERKISELESMLTSTQAKLKTAEEQLANVPAVLNEGGQWHKPNCTKPDGTCNCPLTDPYESTHSLSHGPDYILGYADGANQYIKYYNEIIEALKKRFPEHMAHCRLLDYKHSPPKD